MKCPKCNYTSFDYLDKCKKCGELLEDSRKALNLKMGVPTLFTELEGEPSEIEKPETDKTEDKVDSTQTVETSLFSKDNLSEQLPASPAPTEKHPVEKLSKGVSYGLGSLGSIDESKGEKAPKIELESTADTTDGFELAPSFDTDNDKIEEPPIEEENQIAEFVLSADDVKPVIDEPSENNIPFEFSESDLKGDIDPEISSDNNDENFIELELDMDDEESLDQILANFDPKE